MQESGDETIVIDLGEADHIKPVQQYIEWCDRAIMVGSIQQEVITGLVHKPSLHLFADGVKQDTTLFFDEPETDKDLRTQTEILERLQQLRRHP